MLKKIQLKSFGISVFCILNFFLLFFCNSPVQYSNEPLTAALGNDTTIRLGDTLNVQISYKNDSKNNLHFIWKIDDGEDDSTDQDSKQLMWKFPDTSKHRIIVQAFNAGKNQFSLDTMYVDIKYSRPIVKITVDTSVFINDSVMFNAAGRDSDGIIDHFIWKIDNNGNYLLSTESGSLHWVWDKTQTGTHTIYVWAVDNDGLKSEIDSMVITVHSDIPLVQLPVHDTAVNVHDTLYVHSMTSDINGHIISFQWILDNKSIGSDTANSIGLCFGVKEMGRHLLKVSVLNDDSIESVFDSLVVTVHANKPKVSLSVHDTLIKSHDTLYVQAKFSGTEKKIIAYHWILDGKLIGNDTSDDIRLSWGIENCGMHLVKIFVVDEDSMESDSDSLLINVEKGRPHIIVPHDTEISSLDTFILNVQAVDSNGYIDRYLWKFGGKEWEDSTDEHLYKIFYRGDSEINMTVAARDNDGLIAVGKISIVFNRPPQVTLQPLLPGDTLWVSENGSRELIFHYNMNDPDRDSIKAEVHWGRTPQFLNHTYNGNNDSILVPLDSLGKFSWQFDVSDAWGHTVSKQGHIIIEKEHTICFAGHSIVAGLLGDNNNGGFRAGVIRGLRDSLGKMERLRSIGPLIDNLMSLYPQDDSSFALSGSVGREMFSMLNYGFHDLSADIWVLMMGANNSYNNSELLSTIGMMDLMYSRNHNARIYILNNPPCPDLSQYYQVNYNLSVFNNALLDTIADRTAKGYHVFLVDAYTLLTKNGEYDSTYFSDLVHPNQTGYDLLGQEILRIMRISSPQAITRKEFTLD